MKKLGNKYTQLLTVFTILATILSLYGSVLAVDDGARAYWKGRDGTNVVSFQYLRLDLQASDTQQFAQANISIRTRTPRPISLSLTMSAT